MGQRRSRQGNSFSAHGEPMSARLGRADLSTDDMVVCGESLRTSRLKPEELNRHWFFSKPFSYDRSTRADRSMRERHRHKHDLLARAAHEESAPQMSQVHGERL